MPVLGSNHSTFSARDDGIADRFTVKVPPFGAYQILRASVGVCARQPVDDKLGCGFIGKAELRGDVRLPTSILARHTGRPFLQVLMAARM